MYEIEVILGLLVAVIIFVSLARSVGIPYPMVLVVGGLVLGLVPGSPHVRIDPAVVFLLFIPPLVYMSAVYTPWRDFRANLRPILVLAVGLVLVTIGAVAVVVHLALGFAWDSAFVLATIVAPSDVVAVTAVTERLPLPRRVEIILQGESLANDAVSLVAYRMAIAAVVTGSFSPWKACAWLAWAVLGGVIIGLAVGWLMVWVRRYVRYPPVSITISLLTPFAAYLSVESVAASGVLAVVAAGLYIGRHGLDILTAKTRIRAFAFWDVLGFLLNGLAFILLGLELHEILPGLKDFLWITLLEYAALVSAIVIVVRLVWVFPAAYLAGAFTRRRHPRSSAAPWREATLVSWGGMRGIDSLVTALAVPLLTGQGFAFPERNLIIFLSFAVILATLVLQGLSLPWLIRWLGMPGGQAEEREEAEARLAATQAALARLDELADEESSPSELISLLRGLYTRRLRLYQARLGQRNGEEQEEYAASARRVVSAILQAEREVITRLRDREVISDDVLREVEEDIDLEELRMED